jgi:hypothetical protein
MSKHAINILPWTRDKQGSLLAIEGFYYTYRALNWFILLNTWLEKAVQGWGRGEVRRSERSVRQGTIY